MFNIHTVSRFASDALPNGSCICRRDPLELLSPSLVTMQNAVALRHSEA